MVKGNDPYIWHASTHHQVPSPTLVSHCNFGILVLEDGEVYLHACFFSVPPISSKMSGSV